jgi:hypothetical protein
LDRCNIAAQTISRQAKGGDVLLSERVITSDSERFMNPNFIVVSKEPAVITKPAPTVTPSATVECLYSFSPTEDIRLLE